MPKFLHVKQMSKWIIVLICIVILVAFIPRRYEKYVDENQTCQTFTMDKEMVCNDSGTLNRLWTQKENDTTKTYFTCCKPKKLCIDNTCILQNQIQWLSTAPSQLDQIKAVAAQALQAANEAKQIAAVPK